MKTQLRVLAMGALGMAAGCDRSASARAPSTQPILASAAPSTKPYDKYKNVKRTDKVTKTEAEWKKILTPEQFEILRNKGTEPAFHNAYWDNHEKGTYKCAGCGLVLFSSDAKFHSGTGWPSFYQPIADDRVHVGLDTSHGMERDEVTCARCGGHLGHVFDDGPAPTGLRYCMDSAAMVFEKAK
jgi:peptide-methionine (R)-S-oxide reductase